MRHKFIRALFCNASPRNELFIEVQKNLGLTVMELERTVATRWFYFHRSILKIKMRFEALIVSPMSLLRLGEMNELHQNVTV